MNLIFKDPESLHRMREGPLGPYVDSYAADMRQQGYASPTAEAQIRLVAGFSRWLARRQIAPSKVTAEHCQRYLRVRSRQRRPKSDDHAALKRLLNRLMPICIYVYADLMSVTLYCCTMLHNCSNKVRRHRAGSENVTPRRLVFAHGHSETTVRPIVKAWSNCSRLLLCL